MNSRRSSRLSRCRLITQSATSWSPELLQAAVERASVLLDREVVARRRVDHHDRVAVPVAGVDEVDPPVRLVEVDELRLDVLPVRLPDVRVRGVALDQHHLAPALEQVVEHRHRHHRLADAALASADPVDASPRPCHPSSPGPPFVVHCCPLLRRHPCARASDVPGVLLRHEGRPPRRPRRHARSRRPLRGHRAAPEPPEASSPRESPSATARAACGAAAERGLGHSTRASTRSSEPSTAAPVAESGCALAARRFFRPPAARASVRYVLSVLVGHGEAVVAQELGDGGQAVSLRLHRVNLRGQHPDGLRGRRPPRPDAPARSSSCAGCARSRATRIFFGCMPFRSSGSGRSHCRPSPERRLTSHHPQWST